VGAAERCAEFVNRRRLRPRARLIEPDVRVLIYQSYLCYIMVGFLNRYIADKGFATWMQINPSNLNVFR
jgi:hypothetical protein